MRKSITLAIFIIGMCAVVAASNYLVQFPVNAMFGGINLAEILTWGAFTYPIAFLVTDMTNRRYGPSKARTVVFFGFVLAVILSIWLATPRIAIASGSAFLLAQLLDVSIFDRLRAQSWWKAPFISTMTGSILDTLVFWSIGFAGMFAFLDFGGEPGSLDFAVPFWGVGAELPLWISLAAGDFVVKIMVGLAMLLPYRFIVPSMTETETA